jgi:RimJ/RimL family protein N-acetyltransferase
MIKIRMHKRSDIGFRLKWLNNPKVNKFIGDNPGKQTTLKKQIKWFDDYQKSNNKKFFTICSYEKPIGFMGLSNISKINKNADLFIAIGEDDYRGKGFARKAIVWLINFGFKKLKLRKINLGVIEENISAIKLYKSVGFEIEGIMRDEIYFEKKFHSFYSMAIFSNLFMKK